MRNLTLDLFWISFMSAYQHTMGIVTALLSFVVIFLILTKTPEHGRPLARYLLITQVSIIFADAGWAYLESPVLLLPLTAALCDGTLCGSNGGMHFGTVIVFQCRMQMALAVTFTIHYKYTTIVKMVNKRKITTGQKIVVRLCFFAILELPVAGIIVSGAAQQDLHEFLRNQEQTQLAALLKNDATLTGVAYALSSQHQKSIALAIVSLIAITTIFAGCAYFVVRTLVLLSSQISSMSDRTRNMQRKLTHMLVMQLCIPIIINICPHFVYVSSMIFFWFDPGSMNFVLCVQMTHGCFHSTFLIFTTPSYRRALRLWTRKRKETVVSPLHSYHGK